MSIRAYIVYNEEKKSEVTTKEIDGEEIKCVKITSYQSIDPLFNVSFHTLFFEIISEYGNDYTDDDRIGELYIDKQDWYKAMKNIHIDTYNELISYDEGYGLKIINTIYEWFDKHDYMILDCY